MNPNHEGQKKGKNMQEAKKCSFQAYGISRYLKKMVKWTTKPSLAQGYPMFCDPPKWSL